MLRNPLICLLTVLILVGCGSASTPETQAKAALEAKMETWMAGDGIKGRAPIKYYQAILLNYEIKRWRDKSFGSGEFQTYSYYALVNVELQSKSGAPIVKQLVYTIGGSPDREDWSINGFLPGDIAFPSD